MKVYTLHDSKTVLGKRASQWITDSGLLKYELMLTNIDNLELAMTKTQNPAQFFYGEPERDLEHWCLEVIELQTKVRPVLYDQPLPEGEILFMDGLSKVVERKRALWYAVVGWEKYGSS